MESNPEQSPLQQIIAKVLAKGEKNAADSTAFEVETVSDLSKQVENPIFAGLLMQSEEGDGTTVWLDMRVKYPDITMEQATSLVNLIRQYDPKPEKIAAAFKTYKEFKNFLPVALALGLNQKIQLEKIREEVQKKDPILILIDVAGSILYRCGQALPLPSDRRTNKQYYQIKMHHHYYRPQFDYFLAQLLSHPRVQLGFNTSIMRKNVMPLLFKIFDLPTLNQYRSQIFEVFDQTYTVADIGPGKKPYATKRCLEKVLEHHKCKEFSFDEHNTLIIDSELDKVIDYPKNSIVIKPYEAEEVLKPTEDQSKILLTVRDYVFELLEESSDVREHLKEKKPAFSLWEEAHSSSLAQQSNPELKEASQKQEEDQLAALLVGLKIKDDEGK